MSAIPAAAIAVVAAGFFIATAPITGWWFDLSRVDMLCLFLSMAGSWALLCRRGEGHIEIARGVAGGAIFVLATLTKQSAGPMAIVVTGLAALISPTRAIWAVSSAMTLGGAALVYLNAVNHDFWFYTFSVLKDHPFNLETWKSRIWNPPGPPPRRPTSCARTRLRPRAASSALT
jgi:hypothetical protein